MAGITVCEQGHATKLLALLDENDLFSLAQTTTCRQLTLTSRQDALQAILQFEESAFSLLKRRKIHRKLLFQYLAKDGVPVSPQADKATLIRSTLQHWGQGLEQLNELVLGNLEDDNADVPLIGQPQQTVAKTESSVPGTTTPDNNSTVSQSLHEPPQDLATLDTNGTDFQMGLQFTRWFYQMLNSQYPNSAEAPQDYGPQHFYGDCRLRLLSLVGEKCVDEYEGGEMVTRRLLALVTEEGLKFNPNDNAQGLRIKGTPHGLKVISCCGTLHQASNLVGVFEQQFGLARDPDVQNNWRIKFTNLNLASGQPTNTPTLNMAERMFAVEAP